MSILTYGNSDNIGSHNSILVFNAVYPTVNNKGQRAIAYAMYHNKAALKKGSASARHIGHIHLEPEGGRAPFLSGGVNYTWEWDTEAGKFVLHLAADKAAGFENETNINYTLNLPREVAEPIWDAVKDIEPRNVGSIEKPINWSDYQIVVVLDDSNNDALKQPKKAELNFTIKMANVQAILVVTKGDQWYAEYDGHGRFEAVVSSRAAHSAMYRPATLPSALPPTKVAPDATREHLLAGRTNGGKASKEKAITGKSAELTSPATPSNQVRLELNDPNPFD